jgi:uncharacterized repeat protein (TIGR01451 family)
MCIVKAKKIGWLLGSTALLLLLGFTSAMTQRAAGYAGLSFAQDYPPASATDIVDMRAFKTDGTSRVVPGSTITYTIVITNAGTVTVSNLFLQEFPLDGLGSAYVTVTDPEWKEMAPGVWRYPDSATGFPLNPSETMTVTFTVELASNAPYGSELINKVELTDVPDEVSPGDNLYVDTDIVVPGFNFLYLPLVTKAYAP